MTEEYVRTNPLATLKVPTIPRTIVETFTTDQMSDLLAAAPAPLAITLRIFLDTGVRLNEVTGLRISDVGDGQLRVLGKGDANGNDPERTMYANRRPGMNSITSESVSMRRPRNRVTSRAVVPTPTGPGDVR